MSSQIVYNQDGQTIRLEAQLGKGGEGVIFRIAGSSEYCAKIYDPAKLSTEKRAAKARKNSCNGVNLPDDPTWVARNIIQLHGLPLHILRMRE